MCNLGTYLGLSIMSASGNDTLGQTIEGSSENGILLSPIQSSALSVNKRSPGRWSDLLRRLSERKNQGWGRGDGGGG